MEDIVQVPLVIPQRIASQIAQLSSNLYYVILYFPKFTYWQKYAPMFQEGNNPYLLVLQDQQKTHLQLSQQLIKENGLKVEPHNFFMREMTTGWDFRHMKLSKLGRILERERIDGVWLEVTFDELDYEPESSLIDMTAFDQKINKKEKRLTLTIKEINYTFCVSLAPLDTYFTFMLKVTRKLKKHLNVEVDSKVIKLSYTDQDKNQVFVDFKNYCKLTRKDEVIVNFTEKIAIKKPQYNKEDNFIIIKFQEEQLKFAYTQIRSLIVMAIFDKHFGFKKKGLNSTQYGLRIHDLIVKPCQSLSNHGILDKLFLTEGRYVKIVLAYVVKQQFMFYAHLLSMGDLTGQNQTFFTNLIDKSPTNETHRAECRAAVAARAQKAPLPDFRNKQDRIEPILLYTSNLLIKQQNTSMKLYHALNLFLRNLQFGVIDQSHYSRWQFLFTHSIMKNLLLIKEYQGDLYRGISHKQTHKLGSIMSYKQFNSCSTSREESLSFASTTLYILKKCKVGRQIKDYSFFQKEQEILNPPFTSYKITNIQVIKKYDKNIQQVTMEEIARPPLSLTLNSLKDQKQLHVFWVDGDKGEGVKISKNVSFLEQTTFFIHLRSTKELQELLEEEKGRFKDPTFSAVLITNMFRVENKVPTEDAGVKAIRAFARYAPKGKVLVYIGDLEKAKATLRNNKIELGSNIKISNSQNGLIEFLFGCGIS